MSKFARLLLLWMIALALPFQGVYAAAVARCDPLEHAMLANQVQAHPHAAGEAGAEHMHHALAQASHDGHSSHHHAAAPKVGCNTCGACCASVAPPPAVPAVATPQAWQLVAVGAASTTAVTFVTGGPERPPRSIAG
jgi:hypothetical protein